MVAYCIAFRSPRVSHVSLYGHKVITEAAPRHVGGSISVTGVESTDDGERGKEGGKERERERRERRMRTLRKESRDGQAGVNETSSSSNFRFVNFRSSELGFAGVRISTGNS